MAEYWICNTEECDLVTSIIGDYWKLSACMLTKQTANREWKVHIFGRVSPFSHISKDCGGT